MRGEYKVILAVSILTLLIFYTAFNLSPKRMTGMDIQDIQEIAASNNSNDDIIVEKEKITPQEAENEIIKSMEIISERQENNFSLAYVNDILLEANRVFEQARYAEILRSGLSSEEEKNEARKFLALVNWRDIYYEEVLIYTEKIKERRERAFLIYDSIFILEKRINDYPEADMGESLNLLKQAQDSFYEDRYDDAELFLEEATVELESKILEASTISGLKRGTQGFIGRNWPSILLFLLILGAIGFVITKRVRRELLRKKIEKMKAEKDAFTDLMKKAQIARFKENKISGIVYNIRMNNYTKKLNQINEELPVLEKKLREDEKN